MLQLKRILFPTDFSRCADQALEQAVFLAEKYDAFVELPPFALIPTLQYA